jgi:CDP-diacylglycerol--glycerol-3-phosphate 3-phosphatidyltransferase
MNISKDTNMKLNYIPNMLTTLRISLIPLFILAFYYPSKWSYLTTSLIFSFAALTDWLDGYLARKLGQISHIGAFLDPVADKLIVVVALILLTETHHSLVISIPTMIIVCREIIISALREWMANFNRSKIVAVSFIGKVKTTTQMTAILLLLFKFPQLEDFTMILGYIFLYISTFLTILSMYKYLKAAFQTIE